MADVFISYSRKDTEFVRVLYEAFKASQRTSWVDWNNIPLTADWWAEIERGIEGANTFVFVISPDSIASKVCADEINHAVRNNKRLFPIVRRDATNFEEGNLPEQKFKKDAHDAIKKHNWLMFREGDDFEKSFKLLTETISLDLEHSHQHTRLLVRAIEWGHGRSDSLLLRGDDLASAERWLAASVAKDPQPTELQETYIKNSREVEDASHRAAAILKNAVRIGGAILVGAILLAVGVGIWANKSVQDAQLEVSATKQDAEVKSKNATQAVLAAQKKADDIQKVSEKDARDAAQKVRDANEKTKEAALKVDEAEKNLESAKAEAAQVSQESVSQVAAAQAKIVDAEGKVKIALAAQTKAALAEKEANDNIKIADVRIKILDAKGDFQGDQVFDALLKAVSAGQKLKG